jgi:hypothetical protein
MEVLQTVSLSGQSSCRVTEGMEVLQTVSLSGQSSCRVIEVVEVLQTVSFSAQSFCRGRGGTTDSASVNEVPAE